MGSDGVSDISEGAGEGVGGVVNRADLTSGSNCMVGSLCRWQFYGAAEVRGFSEGDRWGFGKKVLS